MLCGVTSIVAISAVGSDNRLHSIPLPLQWRLLLCTPSCSFVISVVHCPVSCLSRTLCVDAAGRRAVAWRRRPLRCPPWPMRPRPARPRWLRRQRQTRRPCPPTIWFTPTATVWVSLKRLKSTLASLGDGCGNAQTATRNTTWNMTRLHGLPAGAMPPRPGVCEFVCSSCLFAIDPINAPYPRLSPRRALVYVCLFVV